MNRRIQGVSSQQRIQDEDQGNSRKGNTNYNVNSDSSILDGRDAMKIATAHHSSLNRTTPVAEVMIMAIANWGQEVDA